MHSLMIISGGLLLLAVMTGLVARLATNRRNAARRMALVFLPLWLVASLINMWMGVARAGYSIAEELPFFALVFGVPALIALTLHQWLKTRQAD